MGEMSWAALVAYAAASDDRIERYFLEVKSDVDLNTKAGRAKVAKFILGAANRDPGQVARRFGGHAVMLLGVGSGTTHGIAAFEAQDLARDVARWVGVDGPTWDFERIRAGSQLDVIAVVVDPPTGDGLAQVAAAPAAQVGDTIALQLEYSARLRSGRDLQLRLAVDGWDLNLVSERCLGDVDRQVEDNVVLVPLEHVVLLNV